MKAIQQRRSHPEALHAFQSRIRLEHKTSCKCKINPPLPFRKTHPLCTDTTCVVEPLDGYTISSQGTSVNEKTKSPDLGCRSLVFDYRGGGGSGIWSTIRGNMSWRMRREMRGKIRCDYALNFLPSPKTNFRAIFICFR